MFACERGSVRRRRGPAAVALALLLVLAGCGAAPGGDGDGRTVNPALANTPTAASTPPGGFPAGVDRDGVDIERVIDAHRAALANDSWTVTITRTVSGPNGTVERSRARVLVSGSRTLSTVERLRGDDRLTSSHWTNATAAASRRVGWEGAVRLEGHPNDPGVPAGLDPTGGAWLYAAFLDTDPVYAGTEPTDAGSVTVLRATAGRLERAGLPDRRKVRLRARIGADGVVRSLTLRYEVFLGGDPGVVRVELRTTAVGSTTVPRPEWVDRALANATADGGTGTGGDGDADSASG
ncbi:DUF7537 family lipoprotein [Halobaculum gomorrense]|uniref:Uncharacterized protein n=1 Tax=Halobaculum gomorrense TaxID=43928 RepID=A0A1M5MI26_9EURY|nr:hypothetical protein [Halobaculum gomorrense]SHG76906.1 hypothetical protein SAMN05443636_1020 [Halobaculum gomorrense]